MVYILKILSEIKGKIDKSILVIDERLRVEGKGIIIKIRLRSEIIIIRIRLRSRISRISKIISKRISEIIGIDVD